MFLKSKTVQFAISVLIAFGSSVFVGSNAVAQSERVVIGIDGSKKTAGTVGDWHQVRYEPSYTSEPKFQVVFDEAYQLSGLTHGVALSCDPEVESRAFLVRSKDWTLSSIEGDLDVVVAADNGQQVRVSLNYRNKDPRVPSQKLYMFDEYDEIREVIRVMSSASKTITISTADVKVAPPLILSATGSTPAMRWFLQHCLM